MYVVVELQKSADAVFELADNRMYADKAEYYRKNGINRRKNEHIYSAGK